MKKALSIFLSILMILCSCTGFAASALANNFSSEIDIQKALDKNKYDSSTPLTVTVEGTYILSSRLVVYSNTTLNCEGATFIKNYQNSTMLAIGQNQDAPYGRDFYKNITINGGTFDANKNSGSILSFAHASNITINGTVFKDCYNGHHITFAGCNNVNITACTFMGQGSKSGDNMEAVQLDILEESHFPNYKGNSRSYDGTMNENINIFGNVFENVNRGVGVHSVFSGKYMKNINISNNTFNNVSGYAVLASSFLNVTINNNSINNCGAGIYYKSINPKPNSKSQRPNTYKCSGKSYSPTVDKSSQISGNIISIVDTKDSSMKQWPYGIRLYGEVVKSNEKIAKKGDYSVQNITVSNNTISVARSATGIWIDGAKKSNIKNNKITFTNKKYKTKQKVFGIRLANSSKVNLNKNTVNVKGVPYVDNAIFLIKSKSNTLTSNKTTGAKLHGIYLTQDSSATINKCTVSSNKSDGIYITKSTANIKNCTVSSNKGNGIYFVSKSKGSIKNCKIQKNKKKGIYISSAAGKVSVSKIKYSGNKGGKIKK